MTATESDAAESLRDRLQWLMLARLAAVTLLLGSAIVVNVNDVSSFSAPSYVVIFGLIVGTYLATLGYVAALRNRVPPTSMARAQVVGDAILATGLVLVTGGIHSVFTFLFFVTIFYSAIILGRPGAVFAASGSSLGLATIVLLQFGDYAFVWKLLPEFIPRGGPVPAYPLIIHLAGFFTVASLSGHLAEKLGQVGSELERRRLDLRELRALNENIVHSLSSGLLTLDLEGRIVYFNVAAERITGLALEEFSQRPLALAIPELAGVVEAAPAVADLPTRPRFEQRVTRPDGQDLYLGISVSPLQNAQGMRTGYIMIFQDVTELKTMRDAILRQEHLSAIGKLSAAIAHEIRNPLASISGSIEMLRMSLDPPAEERQLMDIVIREVDRLNTLIADFLTYARPAQLRRRPVSLVGVVRDTASMFSRDPSASHLTLELDPSLGEHEATTVHGDRDQLHQVVWNLLRNASEATPPGGSVRLSMRTQLDLRTGRLMVVLTVADTGAGLSDDALPRLFEPFFTTKASGSGLGLATCHRIVTAHLGDITARNRSEGGAEFSVALPVESSGAQAVERRESGTLDVLTDLMDSSEVPPYRSGPARMIRTSA